MQEVYVITWNDAGLELRNVEPSGKWQDSDPLYSVDLPRPSRYARFSHPESGGRLQEAINLLLTDLDHSKPLWMLLPGDWYYSFVRSQVDMQSDELLKQHLHWEAEQRLSGNMKEYNIHVLPESTGSRRIVVVRKSIIDFIEEALGGLDLNFTGMNIEPAAGQSYSLAEENDLRRSIPIETREYEPLQQSINPKWAILTGAVLVVLVGIAIIYYSATYEGPGDVPELSESKQVIPATKTVSDTTARVDTTLQRSPTAIGSPFRQFVEALPAGSEILLAVVSPVDFRFELTGLSNPESWVQRLALSETFTETDIVGQFEENHVHHVVIRDDKHRLPNPDASEDLAGWRQAAESAGLTVDGRTARGSQSKMLDFIDTVWNNSFGIDKFYLTSNGKQMVIVAG